MNKKVINGLILLAVGVLLIGAGVYFTAEYLGTGLITANTLIGKYYYFLSASALVGFVLAIIGWCKATRNYVAPEKKPKTEKPVSVSEPAPATTASANVAPVRAARPLKGMQTVRFSFCGNCGKRNTGGSKFCVGCGEAL